jgi:very-short-patch-repair endonuclease
MTKIFNRREDLAKRRALRHNMTPTEVILWKQLQCSQVANAKFRRQHSVLNYVVDFFCPEVRLALELDGPSHDGDDAVAYDAVRQTEIEATGISFCASPTAMCATTSTMSFKPSKPASTICAANMDLILGVDFSGAAQAGEKIWVSRAHFEGETLRFDFLERAADLPGGSTERAPALAALTKWILANPNAACGLDFPFSLHHQNLETHWRDWLSTVSRFDDAQTFKAAFVDERRRTDINAKAPFSPLNMRLFRQTFHGIRDVLSPLSSMCAVLPLDEAETGRTWLMEICPASLLKKENLYLSYKGKSDLQRQNRETIWREMKARAACSSTPEIDERAFVDTEGDALDALLAAICVMRALSKPEQLRARDESTNAKVAFIFKRFVDG